MKERKMGILGFLSEHGGFELFFESTICALTGHPVGVRGQSLRA